MSRNSSGQQDRPHSTPFALSIQVPDLAQAGLAEADALSHNSPESAGGAAGAGSGGPSSVLGGVGAGGV
eukprot:scaffold202721_cov12-Tisochrysis_lutea.AAC.1